MKLLNQDYINIADIKFVISSHTSTLNFAPEKLVESLISNNIPKENIIRKSWKIWTVMEII